METPWESAAASRWVVRWQSRSAPAKASRPARSARSCSAHRPLRPPRCRLPRRRHLPPAAALDARRRPDRQSRATPAAVRGAGESRRTQPRPMTGQAASHRSGPRTRDSVRSVRGPVSGTVAPVSHGRGVLVETRRGIDARRRRRRLPSGDRPRVRATGRRDPRREHSNSPAVDGRRGCTNEISRRRPIFPGSCPPSIFGAGELNFRVRDGNGWILSASVTGIDLQLSTAGL